MKYSLEQTLTLLLIAKGGSFANSYQLCAVLSRFFDIIDCSTIFDSIVEQHLANFELQNGIHYFSLTDLGTELIEKDRSWVLNEIKAIYGNEKNEIIISNL